MAKLEWSVGDFYGQTAYVSKCGLYHVFWSDDACQYLADAPDTNQHGGWDTAREAKDAMQVYEGDGRKRTTSKERQNSWNTPT